MPRLTRAYEPNVGPVISATVSDPFSYRREDESPRSETITMLVDSGASDSSLSGRIADRLSLPVLGFHIVSGFGASGGALQYLADLELQLDAIYSLPDWKLMRFDSDYDRIQGIIGRDILEHGKFLLDGPKRQFVLEF